jgi:hypothetical protein
MSKHKGGLQKKVSSIFDGVPLESDSVRGGVHRAADTPTDSAPLPASKAPAPPKPAVEPPVARPAVPPPPSAWPKAPPVTPEPALPRFAAPPRSNLAASLASETAAPAPSRSMSPTRSETPRAPQPAPAKPTAPRVVVKQTGPASNRNRNIMLIGGLSVVLVITVLWSTGTFSRILEPAPTPPTPPSVQQGELVRISWQRPSLPLPKRNPMAYGTTSIPDASEVPPGPSDSLIGIRFVGIVDGKPSTRTKDGTTRFIGASFELEGRQIKIVDITMSYVEYEVDGVLRRDTLGGP